MATKDKDKKGPSTQRTGTVGVNAVGVNHGMTRQEAVKPTPEQAMAQLSQPTMPPQPINYSPGVTDIPGSPSYQQYGQQYPQQAPVAAQTGPQQVSPQTATNVQQNPVVQPVQTAPTANSVQPVQQFAMPQQIAMPNGQVINMQQPQYQQPTSVNIKGVGTVQVPNGETAKANNAAPQQTKEPTAAERNAQYEQQKQQDAQKQQYNNAVGEYMAAGGNPNAIRPHSDPATERLAPTAEQAKKAEDYAKAQRDGGDDVQKTLMERLDELTETPEKRAERERREARQRRIAAIAEGLANVFNVGGAVAGAQPAQWKDGTAALYANQEAEADKRRLEYRQALKDMIDYRTAIRNGDIAQARAIEERRKNDFYERKMLEDIASKQANDELKKQKQEADTKRADKLADARIRDYDDKHEINEQKKNGTYQASKNVPKKSSGKSGGRGRGRRGNNSQRGRTSNRTQRQTAADAASKNGVH